MSEFAYNNHQIFYEVDGKKNENNEVIVILNGIMMSTKSWDAFQAGFAKEYLLLRYDMLDQGQSSKVDFNYTQTIQVDILDALLNHLKLDNVSLVGISYGASVALQYTIKHQEKVNKLILANVVAKTSKWLKAIGQGWNQVAQTRDGLAYYNITIPYIYSAQFYDKNITWMEKRKNILIPLFSNPEFLNAMTRLTKSAETHDTLDDLEKITTPTLIISGDQDYLTPVFEQTLIAQKVSNSNHVIIPNCGHASMYEKPFLFMDLVLGFVTNKTIPKIL